MNFLRKFFNPDKSKMFGASAGGGLGAVIAGVLINETERTFSIDISPRWEFVIYLACATFVAGYIAYQAPKNKDVPALKD